MWFKHVRILELESNPSNPPESLVGWQVPTRSSTVEAIHFSCLAHSCLRWNVQTTRAGNRHCQLDWEWWPVCWHQCRAARRVQAVCRNRQVFWHRISAETVLSLNWRYQTHQSKLCQTMPNLFPASRACLTLPRKAMFCRHQKWRKCTRCSEWMTSMEVFIRRAMAPSTPPAFATPMPRQRRSMEGEFMRMWLQLGLKSSYILMTFFTISDQISDV